jgi:fatty-acyl-CoA synthase
VTGAPDGVRSGADVARDWARAIATTQRLTAMPHTTLASLVSAMADMRGSEPALIGRDEQLSYAGLAERSNRYARWALAEGLAPGNVVGLCMENRPDYVAIWLGLTRVGCVVALLSTHLRSDALAHCIASARAGHVIVSARLSGVVDGIVPLLPPATRVWALGETGTVPGPAMARLDLAIGRHGGAALETNERRDPAPHDPALLIYTSGTTGLPKAAYVSHARVLEWSGWFAGMMDARPDDRLYDCLPLYHSTGGVVAIGAMLVTGGAVVIRERFSVSLFWDDVAETGCTIVQYIGELCRYLLQSPPQDRETAHRIRLCCGNGLRGDVWRAFQQRFHIPRILEFYAATEGSVSLYNCEGLPGSIGRVPPFLAHRFPLALIRCDDDTGEPLRDSAGNCIRCDAGEAGEAICRIDGAGSARFEGYTDAAASSRKVLQDVFAAGDRWFRSGDAMRKDGAGFYFFVDRLGETFRWKGENVSTTQVASVVGACRGVVDAVVYGVAIPGTEGKAGMAAVVVDDTFSLPALHDHLARELPSYGRPMFVRLCQVIERTGTFKLSKVALAAEAYAEGPDALWFDKGAAYVTLDADTRRLLASGLIRL